jgi:hypothetical protein
MAPPANAHAEAEQCEQDLLGRALSVETLGISAERQKRIGGAREQHVKDYAPVAHRDRAQGRGQREDDVEVVGRQLRISVIVNARFTAS